MPQTPYTSPEADNPVLAPVGVPDVQQRISSTPDMFGAQVANSDEQLGRAVTQAGATFADIVRVQQRRADAAASVDAMNQVQEHARGVLYGGGTSDPDDRGFLGQSGKQALDSYGTANQSLADFVKSARANLQNDQQRIIFDRQSWNYLNAVQTDMLRHRDQQALTYQTGTLTASAQGAITNAGLSYNRPEQIDDALNQGMDVIRRRDAINGLPPEQMHQNQQEFRSKLYQTVVMRMAADNPAQALDYLKSLPEGALDPMDYARLQQHLQPQVDKLAARSAGASAFAAATGSGGYTAPAHLPPGAIPPEQRQPLLQAAVAGTPVTPDTLGAMVQQESGWNPAAPNGGLGQILPGTASNPGFGLSPVSPQDLADPAKNLRFAAQYLYARGKSAGLSDEDWQNPTKVATALAAYNGGGDPNYVSHVMRFLPGGKLGGMPTGPHYPDDAKAEVAISALPEDQQPGAWAAYQQQKHIYTSSISQSTQTLSKRLVDVGAALQAGADVNPADIPAEVDIRHNFPPDKADEIITNLAEQQEFGRIRQAVNLAGPDEIANMRQQLATGQGAFGKIAGGGKMQVTQADTGNASDTGPVVVQGYAAQAKRQQAFEAAVQQRNQAIAKDPAAFVVQSSPVVQQAIGSGDLGKAGQAILAEQQRLGVPEENQHILTGQQAGGIVHQLVSTDPEKADTGLQLDKLAQQYGSQWPQVFNDLVSVGKLPRDYQFLANMTEQGQTAARADYQRMLTTLAQPKGAETLKQAAGAEEKNISGPNGSLATTMAPFIATTRFNGAGGMQLGADMTNAVANLARYYVTQGKDGTTATQMAYDGLVGQKYDISGSMIAPKGTMDQVQAQTRAAVENLKPEDLGPQRGNPLLTQEDRNAIVTDFTKGNIVWTPNQDGSGLIARRPVRDSNIPEPVRLKDGSVLQIKFGQNVPPAPAQKPLDLPQGGL